MAQTTTTTLATAVPSEFLAKQIIEEVRPFNTVAPLFKNIVMPSGSGKVWHENSLPSTTASSVNEASDITPAARTTSEKTITVAEVGLGTEVTDFADEISIIQNQMAEWAASQGRAIGQKITGDCCALFSSLNSGTAVGSTGVDITIANFLEAMYTLAAANAPGLASCVLHPRQVYDLFTAISAATGQPFSSVADLVRTGALPEGTPAAGYSGILFGVPIYNTTEVDTANSGADYCGAMFTPGAMGIAKLRPIRIEYDRDASKRSTEVIGTAVYGVGELKDTWGVPIETDA